MTQPLHPTSLPFIARPGAMAELMRSQDWSATPLGAPQTWPATLRTACGIVLNSDFPMFLLWGRDLVCLYNDGCIPLLGNKHPGTLGRPFPVLWPEAWPALGSAIEHAMNGEPVYCRDVPVDLTRDGRTERSWFTFSCSPLFDDSGQVCGLLGICIETTERMREDMRQALVLETVDSLRNLTKVDEITETAAALLGRRLEAPLVFYSEIDDAHGTFEIKRGWASERVCPVVGQCGKLSDFGPQLIEDLHAGRPICIKDVRTDSRTRDFAAAYAALGLRSGLLVPLLKDRALVGVLNVYDVVPRDWSDADHKVVAAVGERIRLAMEQARSEAALRAAANRQAVLLELGDALRNLADDPQAMMDASAHALARALDVPRVGYADVDEGVEYAVVGENYNDTSRIPDVRAHRDRLDNYGSALVEDIRAGRVMRVDDIAADPRSAGAAASAHEAIGARASMAVPVQRNGRTVAFMFAHHDKPRHWTDEEAALMREVADRSWAAVERARAELELREASRRKDEFLAMLAHELRNPLAPISSAAELLRMARLDPERIEKTTDIIVRQVKHMTGLIDDLLDVSRVTRGLISLDCREVEIRHVIAEAVEQVRPLITSRRHHLSTHMAPGPGLVNGDRKRLVQVFSNLLANAAKYTPEGGEITVKMDVSEREIAVRVCDTGIGMASELLPKVFELFAQAERTPDRSQGGLGLGLALVRSLAQLHGGRVQAASPGPGKGSVFTVTLPRVLAAQSGAGDAQTGTAQRQTASLDLLVVDDNQDAAQTLALLLENAGHRVCVAYSPQAALEAAQRRTFDGCMLDIGLPGMDGLELVRRLRMLPGTRAALMVAVTGYGAQGGQQRAQDAGFNHYLVKPVNPARLLGLLADAGEAPAHAAH